MIQWLKTKVNPIPQHDHILLLLNTGEVALGKPQPGMVVIGWSILNRPDWIERKSSRPGHVSGEDHPKVFLSDADCDLIRELYDKHGKQNGGDMSYADIADKMRCSKSTVRDIVKCRRRFVDQCAE